MDLKEFKAKYPDIYQLIHDEGSKSGKTEGFTEGEAAGIAAASTEAREEGLLAGAQTERERIKGIENLTMPGHEALVQTMKFDGETTPAAAAIKLVQAENAVRQTTAEALKADGITPIVHVQSAAEGAAEAKDFDALVAEYRAEHTCSKGKAIAAVAKANPEAHAAYLAKNNTGGK